MRSLPCILLLPATLSLFFLCRPSGPAQEPGPLAETATKDAHARLNARRTPIVGVVERVKGAVVNIHSERTVQAAPPAMDPNSVAPTQGRINGMGTGIIIDPRGYIVTNHHVVEDVNIIRVRLSDGTSQNALVLARSHEADLALLKIDVKRPLPVMPLGTAQDLMVGETVVAIGNPYGYEHTVSVGVVSATKRDVSLNKELSYKSLIQTDASINPGNSGGPLLNINGELVGVNVAIRAGAQNIGFAIPVDQMIRVVSDMLRARRRQGAYDGLLCRDRLDATPDGLARAVQVERVEASSPAAAAGLKKGDVVVQVGDVRVSCSYDVERALLDRQQGEHVPVVVRRQSAEQKVEMVLQPAARGRPGAAELIWRKLGIRVGAVDSEAVVRVNRQLHGGLEITAVDADSIASRAGIRRGDILVGLHQWETLTLDNITYVLSHPDLVSFNPLSFHIVRGGQVRRGWLQQVD